MSLYRRLRRYRSLFLFPFLAVFLAACQPGGGGSGGVLLGDSRVYFASPQGKVYALDPESRSRGLTFPAPGEWVSPAEGKGLGNLYAPPVLEGDILYLVTVQKQVKGQVLALSRESGAGKGDKPLFQGEAIVAAPLLTRGMLLVPSGNRLFALDPRSGKEQWPQPFTARNRLWSQPVLVGERVVVGSLDHNLYALELSSGREVWRFPTAGGIASTPATGDGIIFVGSFDRKLYALDKWGRPAWSAPFLAKGWIWNRPLYSKGTVYFGDLEGEFYALDAGTGVEKWRRSLEGGIRASPVLAQDSLVVATTAGWVYSLSPVDGALRWRIPTGGQPQAGIIADLVASGGIVYSPYQDGTLYALAAASGEVAWTFTMRR